MRRTTLRSRLALWTVLAVPALVVAGVVGVIVESGPGSSTYDADFAEAPGLYAGNHVDVLGIPVGKVLAVTPRPGYVVVKMSVRDDVAIPARASALLEAPDVVNDRFINLSPAYSGGPKLTPGGTIPTSRTAVPVSTDEILRNLDQLMVDLGPKGVNDHGAVSRVIAQLARAFGDNGPKLHKTITSVGRALDALGPDGPQLESLLDNLSVFTKAAAADSTQYQRFITDLGTVTSELASDDSEIGGALHNLQRALGALAQFVETNRVELGGAVSNLDTLFSTLAHEQKQLAATIGVAPTALANISNAIDTTAPGGPALVSRYDPTTGATTLTHEVCGNTLLRLLIVTVNKPPVPANPPAGTTASVAATPLDVDCAFSSVIQNLGAPPNSPTGPATTLHTLTGSGS